MKKFVMGLLVGIFLSVAAISIAAPREIKLIINGQNIKCDVPPRMINGRVFVPARFVAEPLGAKAEWDEKNYAVIIQSKDMPNAKENNKKEDTGGKVMLKISGETGLMTRNGSTYRYITKDGNLYVPGRLITDILSKQQPSYGLTADGRLYKLQNPPYITSSDKLIIQLEYIEQDHLPLFNITKLQKEGIIDFTWDEQNQILTIP